METPATRFVEHDGVNIAWQVFGDGPAEILFVPGWVSNLDLFWQYPPSQEFFAELAGFARAAIYDKPGTGLSDPVDEVPPVEIHVEQLIAVMDSAGLEYATIVGVSEGGVIACLAAAARPDRVARVILLNGLSAPITDRRGRGDLSDEEYDAQLAFLRRTADSWGEGLDADRWMTGSPNADAAWGMLQRACATRAVARRYWAVLEAGLSAWDVLPAVRQPVLLLQRRDDPVVRVEQTRAAAQRLPSATLVELDGAEHFPWLGDTTEILTQIRTFVGAPPQPPRPERILATVLFTDIVGSTEQLARMGDAGWASRLHSHAEIVRDGLQRYDGRLIKNTGDGVLATFTGPARGVDAARWNLDALHPAELDARAGLHVGEIELQGDDIAGLAVHVAAHVMSQADGGEVLVSRTVRDLTAGSGLQFTDRGTHTLKGIPEDWQLYALA